MLIGNPAAGLVTESARRSYRRQLAPRLHGGPVVLRPVRATPCISVVVALFIASDSSLEFEIGRHELRSYGLSDGFLSLGFTISC